MHVLHPMLFSPGTMHYILDIFCCYNSLYVKHLSPISVRIWSVVLHYISDCVLKTVIKISLGTEVHFLLQTWFHGAYVGDPSGVLQAVYEGRYNYIWEIFYSVSFLGKKKSINNILLVFLFDSLKQSIIVSESEQTFLMQFMTALAYDKNSPLTKANIGPMTKICQCGAKKFAGETPGLCCSGGKVALEPFPQLPPLMQELFSGEGPTFFTSSIMRK